MITFRDEAGRIGTVAWSPDGRRLAAGSWAENANALRIWDASPGYRLEESSEPTRTADSRKIRDSLRARAAEMVQAKRWNAALHYLDRWIEDAPNDADARLERAGVYCKLKDAKRALADYSKAISLDASLRADAWHSLGHCYEQLGEVDKAIAAFDECVKAEPDEQSHRMCRADVLALSQKWAEAEADLTKIASLGEPGALLYRLAVIQLHLRKKDAYLATCDGFMQRALKANEPEDTFLCAWTLALAPGAKDRAKQFLEFAEKGLSEEVFDNLVTLGALSYRAEQYERAAKTLTKALSKVDQSKATRQSPVYAWLFSAMVHHQLGNRSESADCLRKALEGISQLDKLPRAQVPWNRRIVLQLLRSEAEGKLLEKTSR
jgi:tetratricopeptide (TPR) repeat protein